MNEDDVHRDHRLLIFSVYEVGSGGLYFLLTGGKVLSRVNLLMNRGITMWTCVRKLDIRASIRTNYKSVIVGYSGPLELYNWSLLWHDSRGYTKYNAAREAKRQEKGQKAEWYVLKMF